MMGLARTFFIVSALLSAAAPAVAQSLPGALAWLPPEDFQRWSEVDAILRKRSELKLTVALTPAMISPLVRAALGPWAGKGRVELAARISGDPILTLAASHPAAPRPQDALERAIEAREKISRLNPAPPVPGVGPPGLAIGAGALDGALAAAFGASGASWILVGPYASGDEPWAATGKTVLVPARALPAVAEDSWAAPGAGIYDESASTASVFLAELAKMPNMTRPALGWATVGDLARAKADPRREVSTIAAWPAWDPAAALIPPADPAAKAAWDAYGAAAAAVDRYQNSGTAELNALEAAVELLRKAAAARHYRGRFPEGLPPDLRASLLAVYKRLKIPAPELLYDDSFPTVGAAAGTREGPTGVKAAAGTSWLEFRGPAGTLAMAPAMAGAAGAGRDGGIAAEPWRIRSLRAEWDADAVRLTLRVGRAFAGPPRPVYEIYADVNHVLGAGRVPLLEGRGAVVPARDAWELALSIIGEEARLYRARGGGDPEETAAFKAEWTDGRVLTASGGGTSSPDGSVAQGEVKVAVPRAFMRGNPSRWGWAVVAFAEDPARAGRRPTAPFVGPDGAILLGVLAPADVQKAVLTRANPRVPAARLEP